MATESELGLAWIESTLLGDTTLQGFAPGGVLQTFALPGTTAPYTLVTYHSGNDQVVFGGGRAYAELRFRAVVAGPLSALTAIQNAAARIDTLLTVAAQTNVTGGTLIASFRDMPVSSDEWVDGAKWHVAGGEYRIFAKSS
jgi:hypothetical protein